MDRAPTRVKESLLTGAGSEVVILRASATRYAIETISLIEEYYSAIGVQHRDESAALLHYLADPRYGFWIAFIEDFAAGCLAYRPLPEMGNAGELKRLYVRQAYRKRGVADQLLQVAESFAEAQEVESIYLDTHDGLTTAIDFYERRGYQRCERYNDNAQATIFMRKQFLKM